MKQILDMWTKLTIRQRFVSVSATLAIFACVLLLARMASAPSMALLYSALDPDVAGEVVDSLEQNGATYEVQGGSIYVDSQQRDSLRMTLASKGLPANNGQGYELLDALSGFGTTSQMFDAAYWRAKEGELARTIVSSPHIKSARVHIANSGSSPFRRNTTPTASVTVTLAGGELSAVQAKALRYLVASAVAGLSQENVSVIDGNGALVGVSDEPTATGNANDQAIILRERVNRLLEARVGSGNAVVEVDVDIVSESESIRERSFDPETRVAISTDTRESTASSNDTADGAVTVASNLPDGDVPSGDNSSSQNSETREQVNYEVSETEREIVRVPGAIKRLTVAVLINGLTNIDENGSEIFSPRPPDELAALRELVAASVGFSEQRGDIITLKSMALLAELPAGSLVTSSWLDQVRLNIMSVVQMLVLAVVSLALGLFVVRPVLTNPMPARDIAALPRAPNTVTTMHDTSEVPALTGKIAGEGAGLPLLSNGQAIESSDLDPRSISDQTQLEGNPDPVHQLRSLIGDRQEETVEVLRGWLEEREENA